MPHIRTSLSYSPYLTPAFFLSIYLVAYHFYYLSMIVASFEDLHFSSDVLRNLNCSDLYQSFYLPLDQLQNYFHEKSILFFFLFIWSLRRNNIFYHFSLFSVLVFNDFIFISEYIKIFFSFDRFLFFFINILTLLQYRNQLSATNSSMFHILIFKIYPTCRLVQYVAYNFKNNLSQYSS